MIVRKIEKTPVGPNSKPKVPVVISECGELWLSLNFMLNYSCNFFLIESVLNFFIVVIDNDHMWNIFLVKHPKVTINLAKEFINSGKSIRTNSQLIKILVNKYNLQKTWIIYERNLFFVSLVARYQAQEE
jgi:hypothetical protein